jgi:hypothetical protein
LIRDHRADPESSVKLRETKVFCFFFSKKKALLPIRYPPDSKHMSDEDLDRLITGLSAATAVPLDPAHFEAVSTSFRQLLAQADIVMGVVLPPGTEPAPIFRP